MNQPCAWTHLPRTLSQRNSDSTHWRPRWRTLEFAEPMPDCIAAQRVPSNACAACKPDIISFDAHEGLDLFFADWHALDFMQQGGTVAYGIVPTRPGVNAVDSASIFIRWLKAASLAGDPQKFAQRAMITATCGLGLLDTSAVAESFSVAHSVSKLIRSLAGSPELDEETAFGD